MVLPAYIDAETGAITDGEAWVALNTKSLGSDTASITFTSGYNDAGALVGGVQAWDQYMDLIIVLYCHGTSASGASNVEMRLGNGTDAVISSASYARQYLKGDGANDSAASSTGDAFLLGDTPTDNNDASAGDNAFSAHLITLFDINSGKYKAMLCQSGSDRDGAGNVELWGGTLTKQFALGEIYLQLDGGSNFAVGSYASLFGILPRMTPPSATVTVA